MDLHSKEIHGRITKKAPKIVKLNGSISAPKEPKESRQFVDHMKVRRAEPSKKCKICLQKFYTTDDVKVGLHFCLHLTSKFDSRIRFTGTHRSCP